MTPPLWSACSSMAVSETQYALDPAGAPATFVKSYWWMTFWVLAAVYVITVGIALIGAWARRARNAETLPAAEPSPQSEDRLTGIVSIAVVLTIVVLFVLLIGDFVVGNKSRALANEPGPLTIQLTGHQWWWEVRYMDIDPSKIASDANELHIPAGRPIRLELNSTDVIHSFWAPNLTPKKDLVPGHPTALVFKPMIEGTYWAQCAEFCGFQHAKMRLAVVVHSPSDFERWFEAARLPAPAPETDSQKHGLAVFLGRTCSTCHSIQGTRAGARLGPDLTHVGSRLTLAAGSMPNTMGHLGGWIIDPQSIKPGTRMPQQQLSGDDLQALLDYLESLK